LTPHVWTLGELATRELTDIQAGRIPRGLPDGLGLDRLVPGGIPRDKVTVLFGESGTFKTTTLLHMLLTMAGAGQRSLLVTLEDSAQLTAHRFLARESNQAYGAISGGVLTADERAGLAVTEAGASAAANVRVVDDIDPSVERILWLANGAKQAVGLDVLAIDYIQQLEGRGNPTDIMTDALKKLQRFATTTGTAVILVSQQKQEKELERDDPRPRLGDMLGSSAMRIYCKLVLGLHRPWSHNKNPTTKGAYGRYGRFLSANPENGELYPNLLECWVLKNVLGPNQVAISVLVDAATGLMTNADLLLAPYS
jgi:KaiC/GvpD/RAD55 family RecA-like ATPase